MVYISIVGAWAITYGQNTIYLLLFCFGCSYTRSLLKLKKPLNLKLHGFKSYLHTVVNTFFLVFFALQFSFIFKGYQKPENSIDLAFPFKRGRFGIIHGGSNIILNHHYFISAQRYALDIVQVNRWGHRCNSWLPRGLKDYYIFETEIFSPCSGTVIEAQDMFDDQEPGKMDPKHIAGNFIAISNEKLDIVILLAHLRKNSLQVKVGDKVSEGQYIAQVGNTGNTSEPHLHIHAVKRNYKDLLIKGDGVPITFQDRFFVRNSHIDLK